MTIDQCPTCGQRASTYRRSLTATGARLLVLMSRCTEFGEYINVPHLAQAQLRDVAHQGGYLTLGHYWGLIVEAPSKRTDGGRAGWWRLSLRGWDFAQDLSTIPRWAHIYDGQLQSFSGEPVSIRHCLGTKFDYDELIALAEEAS